MADVSGSDFLKAGSSNGISLISNSLTDMGDIDAAKLGEIFAGLNLEK